MLRRLKRQDSFRMTLNKYIQFSIYKIHYSLFIIHSSLIFAISCTQLSQSDKEIVGEVSWQYWMQNAGWDSYDAIDYQPSPDSVELFKKYTSNNNLTFVIFASSFCDECQIYLPRLFKLFELANVPESRVGLIGLDKYMTEPSGKYKKYDIDYTPCLFIFKDSVLIKRVGSPDFNWLHWIINN